jgi:hypothetical protein
MVKVHQKWYKQSVMCNITTDLKRSEITEKNEMKETRQKTNSKAFLEKGLSTSKFVFGWS